MRSGGGDARLLQGVQRGDPRRHRGGEGLAEERAEGHVLPGLDVAGGPVVEQTQAEDVVAVGVERHGPAPLGGDADDEADLGLDVQPHGRAEDGSGVRGRLALPGGAHHVGAGHHDGAGAAVVTDRQVLPVGGQGVRGVGAENLPDVPRVVLRGVEVDVVRHLERQMQGHLGQRVEEGLDGLPVRRDRHPRGERAAHVRPGRAARRQQRVEAGAGEQGGVGGAQGVCRRAGVEDVVAQPDAHGALRRTGEREDAVRQVVRAEGVALGDIEGGIGCCLAFVCAGAPRVRGRATRYGVASRWAPVIGDGSHGPTHGEPGAGPGPGSAACSVTRENSSQPVAIRRHKKANRTQCAGIRAR